MPHVMPLAATSAHQDAYVCIRHRVFYEIFIRSFRDSNNDGIGDINGIRQALPYLAYLGVGGIWITPVFLAPSYHKYDPLSLTEVDPEYGTLADLRRLIEEAHRHDMLVLLDFVANHTSWKHPWFLNAVQHKGPFGSFYVWKANPAEPMEGQWHRPAGRHADDVRYYACFSRTMPDLNFDHRQVRRLVTEAACFWLQQTHADGFRLDAAQHIYPSDQIRDNVLWWKEFAGQIRKVKPDAILIGECWNSVRKTADYLEALDGVFNFELAEALQQALLHETATGLAERLEDMLQTLQASRPDMLMATFLSNHDTPRILSVLNNDLDKMRLAARILLTLPGLPFVYYGEEIGMRGRKPDPHLREPFVWSRTLNWPGQTHWMRPTYSTRRHVVPALEQTKRRHTLFHTYRQWIAFRKRHPAISSGKFHPVPTDNAALLAYQMQWKDKSWIVVHNLSRLRQYFRHDGIFAQPPRLLPAMSAGVLLRNGRISVPPLGTAVLES